MMTPHPIFTSAFAATAITTALVTAIAGLGFSAPAPAAAAGATFLSSFESADPQPLVSTSFGTQSNVSGRALTPGSILGAVSGVTATAENLPGEPASMLADGDPTTKWLAFTNTATITYQLSSPKTPVGYTLTSANDDDRRDPRDFVIEGSNDGLNWATVDSRTGNTFSGRGVTQSYTIATPGNYSYFRLRIVAPKQATGLLQLAGWDLIEAAGAPATPFPMVSVVGVGPISGYNIKPNVGFSGTRALRYSAVHLGDGPATGTNQIFDVDLPISAADQLSYKIFPVLDAGLTYAATHAAVDLVFTDGSTMSASGVRDVDGFVSSALSYGQEKVHYADQWNSVRVDLSSFAGRTIDKILFQYDNPGGSSATTISGWLDDVRVAPALPIDGSSLTHYVDTRRGTLSSTNYSRGNNFPATALPNGFNFFTPMTNADSDSVFYRYNSANNSANLPTLQGIGISHAPSPWMGDRNQLAIMPSTSTAPNAALGTRALPFDHANEIAQPDLYSVKFTNNLIAEVTPTDHGAVYRFQFPGASGSVLLDTVSGNGDLVVNSDGTVSGWVDGRSGSSAGATRMFIAGTFDRTPSSTGTGTNRSNSRFASFSGLTGDRIVELRIATSFISVAQAQKNLDLEVTGRSFSDVRTSAQSAWNDRLSVIDVEGANDTQLTTLYSNLYRLNLYPNSQFENVGTAGAPDYKYASPVAAVVGQPTATATNAQIVSGKIYVNNGFWDTYRTVWPAYSLLYPDIAEELVDGFVQQYRDGGWVARWSSPGYADLMTGTSSDIAFADSYINGALDTHTALDAYDAALKNATALPSSNAVGRKGLDTSIFLGFTPEETHESVSWALEGFINDYGIGQMAAKLAADPAVPEERRGELNDESTYFLDRAQQYVNQFDPGTGFFRTRNSDGTWHDVNGGYDPKVWGNGYTETNGWNFAYHAPFDVDGLAALHGGTDGLVDSLDTFYGTPETGTNVGSYGSQIHEMLEARDIRMGQLGFSNQVSHHIPYISAAAGDPTTTQEAVREILQRFSIGADIGLGYGGDEDNGETSSWWLFSSLGFYPLALGSGEYTIGSPQFTKATVHLPGGDLVIDAPNNSPDNIYVQGVTFDGQPIDTATISHDLLADGGTLSFDLDDHPSSWGERTSSQGARVPHTDATKAGFGTISATDTTAAAALTDDNSRSAVTFTSQTPTISWDSSVGPVTVPSYTLTSAGSAAAPTAWALEASADGDTWVTLDERTSETFRWDTQTRPFIVDDPHPYEHYRLVVDASSGASPQVAELQLLSDPTADAGDFALFAATDVIGAPAVPLTVPLANLSGGSSSDAGDYVATVDFGDGAHAATLTRSGLGGWQVSLPRTFARPGLYTARVTVTEGMKQASVLTPITIVRDDTLIGAFTSVCITDPGAPRNCDGGGYTLSRPSLVANGFAQGQTISVPGTALTFDLPAIPAGQPDNAMALGQTIHVDLGTGATRVSVIGTATERTSTPIGRLNFTDGTSIDFPMSFGDWVGSASSPQFGNIAVGYSDGRVKSDGVVDTARAAIFSTAPLAIPTGKSVLSITMPTQTASPGAEGRIHVFAVASDGVRTPAAALEVEASTVGGKTTAVAFDAELATVSGGTGRYAATINWGDGTTTTDAVVDGLAISGGHTYATAGDYVATVTVDDGATSSVARAAIAVLDPWTPSIAVAPGAVEPGASVAVTGSGFAPGESVQLTLSSTPPTSVQVVAAGDGSLSATIVVPSDAADGSYPLTALGVVSAVAVVSSVTVAGVPAPIEPEAFISASEARPGDPLTVEGIGFDPFEPVDITIESTPVLLATVAANARGSLSTLVLIPASTPAGAHHIVLTGTISGITVRVPLAIAVTPPPIGVGPADPGYVGLAYTGSEAPPAASWMAALWLIAIGSVGVGVTWYLRRSSKGKARAS